MARKSTKNQEPAAVLPGQMPLPLKAKPHCCEEASTMSGKFYIPCNRPAVAIVGWKGRSEAPIRMCDQCEFHNVKNRGGYRVQAYDAGVHASPPAGHNSDLSDDALIAENFKIEDLIKAAQAKFNEWAEPHKTRLKEIEDTLFARLAERKADSTKTDSGTAYISNIMNAKVDSVPTLFDFVAEHWADVGDEVKINIPISVVREHMENNNGMVPPGMSVSHFSRLNIKRS